jgi:PKD repeat protein
MLMGCASIANLLMLTSANGATNTVSSIAALRTAINNAHAGDVIVLANGTYSNNTFIVSTSAITVKAATPGGVFLIGTNNIDITASRTTLSGFQFTYGAQSDIPIFVTGSSNLLTQLNFDGYSAQKYIHLDNGTVSNVVAYCNFRNKPVTAPIGNLIHVAADASVVGYHKIRYCSFQDMPGAGGDNGNECIRLSNGAQSNYIARTVVEYCYFENTGPGDSEAISVKCRENILRYNTFTNNPNAMMVFRNGNNNIGYGNFFINAGGIRAKEANNIFCYNNYFENSGVGGTMDAITLDSSLNKDLNNINFIHNTFINCGTIDLGGSQPTGNTWANNIFKKSSGNIFLNPNGGTSWAGNIYQGTLGISIPSGMTSTNPQLVLNADGYYGLSSNSPAIDAASTNYPAILDIANVDDDPSLLLDISGQPRPASRALKDVGCDEYTNGVAINRPLTLADVGPSYLGGPGGVTSPVASFTGNPTSGPTPLSVTFTNSSTGQTGLSHWDFGNGTLDTNALSLSRSFTTGTYTVSLIVTNAGGSSTNTKAAYITVLPPAPTANFTATPTNGATPFSATFTNTSTGQTGLSHWDFGNGSLDTNALSFTRSYTTGTYTVSLIVTNAGGSSTNTKASYITVLPPPPAANFTATPTNGVAPLNATFTDTTSNSPTSWAWDFGDTGASALPSPSHNYATAGVYSVRLISSNAGGSSTNTKTAYINVITALQSWSNFYGAPANSTDADGDGISNTNEFLTGFNPTNATAYAHIISLVSSGSDMNITYLGANGDTTYAGGPSSRTNVLECSTVAADGSYTNNFANTGISQVLSNGTGSGIVANFVDPGGATNVPSRYYHIRVLVP